MRTKQKPTGGTEDHRSAATSPTGAAMRALPRLKAVALICGAALMGLEMAGVRLLEPHFGSTIYVWGAIIGVFLGSLALGYWTGGMLADRSPRFAVLGALILAAAGFMFVAPVLATPLCRKLVLVHIDPRLRVLLASSALYAIPSVLLGMVSPFAVRLAADRLSGMGSVAGTLYAISTVGSIAGTFLVAFVLTEWIGSRWIVFGIAALLVLVSLLCFLEGRGTRGAAASGCGLALLVAGYCVTARAHGMQYAAVLSQFEREYDTGPSRAGGVPGRVLDGTESAYHQIAVVESLSLLNRTQRARYLVFNNQLQSGITVDAEGSIPPGPVNTACGYARLLHVGVLVTEKAPERVLIIGCGGGIGAQAFSDDYAGTVRSIDVVDIDPAVFSMARKWFRFPAKDGVIRAHVEDGRVYLVQSREKWDYIVLDAFSSGGRIPRHLITREFFELVRERLTPGGVVVANIISAQSGETGRLYQSVARTMRPVFGERNVWAFPRYADVAVPINIMLVGRNGSGPTLDGTDMRRRWEQLEGRLLKQSELGDVAARARNPRADDVSVPILTDDYCPTDSMIAY